MSTLLAVFYQCEQFADDDGMFRLQSLRMSREFESHVKSILYTVRLSSQAYTVVLTEFAFVEWLNARVRRWNRPRLAAAAYRGTFRDASPNSRTGGCALRYLPRPPPPEGGPRGAHSVREQIEHIHHSQKGVHPNPRGHGSAEGDPNRTQTHLWFAVSYRTKSAALAIHEERAGRCDV